MNFLTGTRQVISMIVLEKTAQLNWRLFMFLLDL